MQKDDKITNNKVLYISGYGNDSNETVVYALTMPVCIIAHVDDDGTAAIEFWEKTGIDEEQLVCRTNIIPDVEPPADFAELKYKLDLDGNVAKTVAGWVSIFMREGIFCTDSCKETFVHFFDLRDIAARLEKNLEEVYEKYKKDYN